jgi:hypothetical protein
MLQYVRPAFARCGEAFVAAVERHVEAAFEADRTKLPKSDEIPIIGMLPHYDYDPTAPREEHVELKAMVARAICARKWFEFEAPAYCQPLPISEVERLTLTNSLPYYRNVVANYVSELRGAGWHVDHAKNFLDFYAASCRG